MPSRPRFTRRSSRWPAATRWLALALPLALAGCMRSGPLETAGIDCAGGALVVIDSSALCVYRPLDWPEMCPEALPNRFEREGVVICARQTRPAGALLDRAVDTVLGRDGGIFIVDGGPAPPTIVDGGGANRADF